MTFFRQSDEVYYTTSDVTTVSAQDIAFLKARAAESPRRRVRLCAHRDVSDPVHEMLIVHMLGHYARPHKHISKSESFHMIEGRLKIFIFDDDGRCTGVVEMSEPAGGGALFYRLASSTFHSVFAETEFIVFHEVTNGPFDPRDTMWAPWAPAEADVAGQAVFLASLASHDARAVGGRSADDEPGNRWT